ncbi:glyoxylate/hydroxypyruvate reductase GhrB [Lonsdalea populi]|uniref:glyoxylate/hydroxypyruvate reductase GhrB n=1 Tax=Lonsdalea populi TaxID=1172565 RepID=UPI000A234F91|nr:glyoxylate/hydroxypyruvate reductase GhrB [Lonsdalea populi]OSM97740.1 D-glycerate dehydrogenase [Lonsdalea populi]RAT69793.1 D-glycerate dehydrogenase [Lonsdalea populi]RAT71283.1 D-glycerate dehydrogenase [Lonsdalea populi]RAT76384.1 D-glycerate dehydrogenase [Lonsdalea populi]RAT77552.1 D-glycerate dehydrogenase [Lonsdalea populi]
MKPEIILYGRIPEDLRARLSSHFTVNECQSLPPVNDPSLARAEGLIGAGGQIDQAFLSHLPRLRAVSTISVGYDNIDVAALNQKNALLMHTPTVLTDTVADTVMTLMLMTARRALESAERVKAGEWRRSIGRDWYGVDVHHKAIGILGMGRIGMAVAQRAHFGFNMPVRYHARRRHPEAERRFNAHYDELETLLTESDFLCITLPLTPETRHLINRERLEKMKPGAILINIGRGPVVDELALIDALRNGQLLGAGLDVFETEPLPVDSPLLTLPNVVALPHIGSATHETRYAMAACAVDNLIAALTGDVKENCVNPPSSRS